MHNESSALELFVLFSLRFVTSAIANTPQSWLFVNY